MRESQHDAPLECKRWRVRGPREIDICLRLQSNHVFAEVECDGLTVSRPVFSSNCKIVVFAIDDGPETRHGLSDPSIEECAVGNRISRYRGRPGEGHGKRGNRAIRRGRCGRDRGAIFGGGGRGWRHGGADNPLPLRVQRGRAGQCEVEHSSEEDRRRDCRCQSGCH